MKRELLEGVVGISLTFPESPCGDEQAQDGGRSVQSQSGLPGQFQYERGDLQDPQWQPRYENQRGKEGAAPEGSTPLGGTGTRFGTTHRRPLETENELGLCVYRIP